MKLLTLLTLALPLLFACSTMQPMEAEVLLPKVPEQWQAGASSSGTSPSGEVRGDWWQDFQDESLNQVVLQTLHHNPDVFAAHARLAAAAIQADIAGADLYPSLDAGFGWNRQRQNFIGFPIPGSGGSVLSQTFTSYGVNLNTSWELDLWGRIKAGEDAAVSEFSASMQDLRALQQSLAGQAAKAWFALLEAQHQLTLTNTTVQSFAVTERQVESRFQRGIRSSLDLRLARTNLATAKAQQELWRESLDRARRQLQILQGQYPDGETVEDKQMPVITGPAPAGLPAQLMQRRPDLAAAELRLVAAGHRTEAAKAALYPRISLTGSAGTSTAELEDLVDTDFFVWSLAANLTQPIFQGGRLRNEINLSVVREDQALAELANLALRAYGEVESALAAEQYLATRESLLAEASKESIAARDLSEDRYRKGLEDFITVLSAQRSALNLESQWLGIKRQRLDLRVDLHLALGGGFQADTSSEENLEEQP